MSDSSVLNEALPRLLQSHPYLHDFFEALSIDLPSDKRPLKAFIFSQPQSHLARFGLDHQSLVSQVIEFISRMEQFQNQEKQKLHQVTIKAGVDKSGDKELMDVDLFAGEMVSIVGPTGSGKSRLLADIECLAQGDTPSGRRILLDGKIPDDDIRFSGDCRLVAQLSQNMNFVMDLTVRDFVKMHAESRLVDNIQDKVSRIFRSAVGLAGEPFALDTPVTALSGGQSRALMIADVAFLSTSPVVLIDEIENAGVDRRKALELLVKKEKIVLLATHDPMLALSGHKRIVIRNGGIVGVMETSESERKGVACLTVLDKKLALLREKVRKGDRIVFDHHYFFMEEKQ